MHVYSLCSDRLMYTMVLQTWTHDFKARICSVHIFSIFLGTNNATVRVYIKDWQTIVHRPHVVFPHDHALTGN